MLAIASLATKLEGIIRDLAEMAGVATFYFTPDHSGRCVAREKDAQALLHEQPLTDLLGPDGTLFLRYAPIRKVGAGLRHQVAHALMLPSEYNAASIHLLFVALLRLSKYQVGPVGAPTGSSSVTEAEIASDLP